jgi:hypothetical protein
MFVTLTNATDGTPLLVNLDQMLYAYRHVSGDSTVIVFGKVVEPMGLDAQPAAKVRAVAARVTETLKDIQMKRRSSGG